MAKTKARTRRKDRKANKPACTKFAFAFITQAQDHAVETEWRTGEKMRVYWCHDCRGYHITHSG